MVLKRYTGLFGLIIALAILCSEVWAGRMTVAGDDEAALEVKTTGTAATDGPAGEVDFQALNADSDVTTYAQIDASINNSASGAETGVLSVKVSDDGTLSEKMQINGQTGYVGIGRSPSQELHVYSSSANADVRLQGSDSSYHMDVYHGSSTQGLWGTGAIDMRFGTNGVERMRIDSDGNVGIGTSSPESGFKLSLVQGTSGGEYIYGENSGGDRTLFVGNDVTNNGLFVLGESSGSTKIVLAADSDDKSYINAGNVGIGTNDPSKTLDVNGDMNVTVPSIASSVTFTSAVSTGSASAGIAAVQVAAPAYNTSPLSVKNTTTACSAGGISWGLSVTNTSGAANTINDTGGGDYNRRGINIVAGNSDALLTKWIDCKSYDGSLYTDRGGLQSNGSGVMEIFQGSDERIKSDIRHTTKDSKTIISNIDVIDYHFQEGRGRDSDIEITGFSAQNLMEVLPEAVMPVDCSDPGNADSDLGEVLHIAPMQLIPVMVAELQRQQQEIDIYEERIDALESSVEELKKRVGSEDPRNIDSDATTSFADSSVELPFSICQEDESMGKGQIVDMSKLVAWAESKMTDEMGSDAGKLVYEYEVASSPDESSISQAQLTAVKTVLANMDWIEVAVGDDGTVPEEAFIYTDEQKPEKKTKKIKEKKLDCKSGKIMTVEREVSETVLVSTGNQVRKLKDTWKYEDGTLYRRPTVADLSDEAIERIVPETPQWVLDRTSPETAIEVAKETTASSLCETISVLMTEE